ncbi:Heparan-sulfate 6-O-sulfotransferase 2 [Cricetulus griseus]|uniref:Heparan-sulfate 6-O-sulfotransferase n=1 Tax=Cricetulus griseus TaxID=10029 RepID=G3HRB7_CRIGR|nr:Heparan-sulfate 6-O-sulfotransferase 2 [Cricetulus griseus]
MRSQLYLSNNLIPHLLYVGDHSCLTKSTFVEEFLSLIMPNHMDLGVSGLWATRVYVMYAVECVSQNFHYITILRDPVSRYLSEWRHVQRGATWKASLHVCDGRPPTSEELPSCYTGDDWSGCLLKEFMDCPYNLANNRQVRMLSDLTLVGCYNLSVMPEKQRNKVLLESAKSNLKHMAFFGLTEFQRKTQYLFEKTFNMNFISPFTQYNTTRASSVEINEEIQKRIEGLNFLDMELYSFAKDLFLQRYQFMRQKEHQDARRKRQEQRKFLKGRFLQTHFLSQSQSQSQSQGQNQSPGQNLSQSPNPNPNQNLTQNVSQNLTQSSKPNLIRKENRGSQKQGSGQEQSHSSTSNGTNDYIGSVETWR